MKVVKLFLKSWNIPFPIDNRGGPRCFQLKEYGLRSHKVGRDKTAVDCGTETTQRSTDQASIMLMLQEVQGQGRVGGRVVA